MKLNQLNNIINFSFDLTDNEVDGSFYIELDEVNPKYAKQIEVVKISKGFVCCKFTDFIRHHKTAIKKYLNDYYIDCDTKTYLINQLCKSEDILDDGGEAVYHFIENDFYDFLTQEQ